jgi:primosomal protein N' (replication factor Y)
VRFQYSSIHDRQIYKYPPYFKIIKLTLKHRDYDKLKEGSSGCIRYAEKFKYAGFSPEEPAISRIRNEYIYAIIKIPVNISL